MIDSVWRAPSDWIPSNVMIGMTKASWGNTAPYVGDSNVSQRNRDRLCRYVNVSPNAMHYAQQVHGTAVVLVNAESEQFVGESDGLVTEVSGRLLMTFAADCVPIWVTNSSGSVGAVLHAGWRGSAAGMATKSIERLARMGYEPSDLRAVIGPCIQGRCYEVGLATARQFPAEVTEKRGTKWFVDLPRYNLIRLLESGLDESGVHTAEYCVHCDLAYYSYRRQGQQAGRMAAFLVLKTPSKPRLRPAEPKE